ncbi:MAG: Rpn family recombination-promoting nuclease/putative transposase [Planctomycetota bacterium]
MTSHPHDALFKSSLTPDAALALCRAVLPPEVSARFAGAELSPVPVTFIEPSLSEVRSDVCYSAKVGGAEALVYVLTEHQSSVDPLMAFRVLRYMTDLWTWWLGRQEGNPATLPLVIPIVVYHGERAWSAAQSFQDLIESPLGGTARTFVPDFRYQLDDLPQRSEADLRARQAPAHAVVSWIFLRSSHAPDRGIEVWRRCHDLLEAVAAQPEWKTLLEGLVSYSLVRGLGTTDELRSELRSLGGAEAEEVAVTEGERLLERGREQGRDQCLLEGERNVLRLQLRKQFGLEALPEEVEQRIKLATAAQLDVWAERVLDAATLAGIFE